MTNTRNNGIRIEAVSPNINKIKSNPNLAKEGLRVIKNIKLNPRLIIHGVPAEMIPKEIKEELITQNLDGDTTSDLKVIYIYQPKTDKFYHTSCVLEVAPEIRKKLLNTERIFLRYSACNFADYIRTYNVINVLLLGTLLKTVNLTPYVDFVRVHMKQKNVTTESLLDVATTAETRRMRLSIMHILLSM